MSTSSVNTTCAQILSDAKHLDTNIEPEKTIAFWKQSLETSEEQLRESQKQLDEARLVWRTAVDKVHRWERLVQQQKEAQKQQEETAQAELACQTYLDLGGRMLCQHLQHLPVKVDVHLRCSKRREFHHVNLDKVVKRLRETFQGLAFIISNSDIVVTNTLGFEPPVLP